MRIIGRKNRQRLRDANVVNGGMGEAKYRREIVPQLLRKQDTWLSIVAAHLTEQKNELEDFK